MARQNTDVVSYGGNQNRGTSYLKPSKSLSNVLESIQVFSSENVSSGHLDTGEGRPRSQQLWSSGPAGSKDYLTAWLSSLPKYEEVQEPVGGGAVDVDHVADVAFTFSCLLPETHGIGWCRKVNRVNCLDVSPVATHHHETAIVDGHREVGARLQHIGHLSFPLKWLAHSSRSHLVPPWPGARRSWGEALH